MYGISSLLIVKRLDYNFITQVESIKTITEMVDKSYS